MKILVMGGTGAMGHELVPMLASNESNKVICFIGIFLRNR